MIALVSARGRKAPAADAANGQLVRLALKDVALAMLGNFGMLAERWSQRQRPTTAEATTSTCFCRDFATLDGKR